MARLLVPTRNRPTALGHLLGFLDRFYPGTEVVVADGSSDAHKADVKAVAKAERPSRVEYLPYPFDMPFFDRLLDVLENAPDPFFVMGADDDYPMMDVFQAEEAFLDKNSDYVTALGASINLKYDGAPQMVVRLNIGRPIEAKAAEKRADFYSRWPFPTTYAITRRDLLIERYKRARQLFLAGFYDSGVGIQDCIHGKIRAVDKIGVIGTRNTNHSYLRPESRLVFARRSEDLLRYLEFIKSDLITYARMNEDAALQQAEAIVLRFVADRCGRKAPDMAGFDRSDVGRCPVARRQSAIFGDLFTPGTETRRVYEDRLTYVANALLANFTSTDNDGENRTYETLLDQAGAGQVIGQRG